MRKRILLLLLVAFCAPLCARAQDADVLLRRIDDHYNRLKSLRARYTEHYAGMGIDRTESGTLLLKKPGRMRWSYDEPEGKLFVLDGKFAWFYSPGDAQAQRTPASKLDDLRSPLRFLLGHTQLKKELVNVSVTEDSHGIHVAGVPQGMEQRIRRLTLDVTASGQIQHMKLEELDGAITEFSFTQVQENVPTREADFVFSPPAGVSVVDALPPV
ncbi:outer membrane lipoprotein chaperone LolA [Edaphobacter sp. 12200R-103]|jgi:outer membrane lipoprotein carrier protein|uniref:outer membrane lipoprotein chaperone LolA n=1 Tax=Edaphobacter sp. 12200R-103 TaxID=2703788 RepID=UPI00138B733F|nr:outer membrane lipoprotein chaperone LolA [Edaphobacter sp. 12200R-103]QHS51194.1 outer membrane lipoprotein chaperone LolA [Edaphobacter sp. 12200R-103]